MRRLSALPRETVSEPPPRLYFSSDEEGGEPSVDEFRSKVGFLCMLGVAFTSSVYLMTFLRTVLEPFLWALFLVIALQPIALLIESLLLCLGRLLCGCRRVEPEQRRCRLRNQDAELELQQMTLTEGGQGPLAPDLRAGSGESLWRVGTNCCECVSHVVAVSCALTIVIGVAGGVAMFIMEAALRVKEDMHIYEKGATDAVNDTQVFFEQLLGDVPKRVVDKISENLLNSAKVIVSSLLGQLIEHAGKILIEGLMFGLYVMFWLCTPMPLNTSTERIFRRYLFLKGGACTCYGVCVGFMLQTLEVQMAGVFGFLSFLFAFIPEVGAFFAMALPMPVILFDSRLGRPFLTLFVATASQLCLKFVFSNIIEVKLVENDSTMKMHPVITLLAVTFFGVIWGPTGMLLSVPIMTYLKLVILTDKIPSSYRDPVLILLEGDRRAPQRFHRREAKRTLQAGRHSQQGARHGAPD